MPLQKATDFLKEVSSVLVAIAGLVAALAAVGLPVTGLPLRRLPASYLALAAVLLIGVAAGLQWNRLLARLGQRSIIRDTGALNIGQKYLEGREEDIEQVLACLGVSPLVWLTGESGIGKSSLLVRGVLPRLQADLSNLAVYVQAWGADWVQGPEDALVQALRRAIAQTGDAKLSEIGPGAALHWDEQIDLLEPKLGRMPILLFDQFDDYQARHGDRFLTARGTILPADDFAGLNPFWGKIRDLIAKGRVRCLFVTRDDARFGLESVRFGRPEVIPLKRLARSFAADLLNRITEGNAVLRPERGFEKLKRRVVQDLGADEWVLPIQMRVAFRGLGALRSLTVEAYEKEGGLTGLEALHVGLHATEAARLVGWTPGTVHRVLLEMVDRAARKTVARTEEDLLGVLSGDEKDAAKLAAVLKALETEDIVRQRADPDRMRSIWSLDHDYLCRGVLELDRRAQRWPRFLEEAAGAFAAADGILDKWRALLAPLPQFRILWARLRSRLRYGPHRGYGLLSTLRLIANPAVVATLLVAYAVDREAVDRSASRLFSSVEGSYSPLRPGAYDALWELTEAREAVRIATLRKALAFSANAERFEQSGDHLIHAVVGLDPDMRRKVVRQVLEPDCYWRPPSDPSISAACAKLALALDEPSLDGVRLLSWTMRVEDGWVSDRSGDGLQRWAAELSSTDADQAFDFLLADLKTFMSSTAVGHFGAALEALAPRLSPGAAKKAPEKILAAMKEGNHELRVAALGKALAVFGSAVPPEWVGAASRLIVSEMHKTDERGWLVQLGEALAALGERVPSEVTREGADLLLKALQSDSERTWQIAELGKCLAGLQERLPPEYVEHGVAALLDKMQGTTYYLPILVGALQAFGDQVPANQIKTASEWVLRGVQRSMDENLTRQLAEASTGLAPRLPPEEVDRHFAALIASQRGKNGIYLHPDLVKLAERTTPEGNETFFTEVAAFVGSAWNYHEQEAFLTVLRVLGPRLAPDAADRISRRILDDLGSASEKSDIGQLGQMAGTMADRLPRPARERIVSRLLDALSGTTDEIDLGFLAAGLNELGNSSDRAVEQEFLGLFSLLGQYPDVHGAALSDHLVTAAGRLAPAAANRIAGDVVAALEAGSSQARGVSPQTVAKILEKMGEKFSPELAAGALERMLRLAHKSDFPCGVAAPLVRRSTVTQAVELMKTPTCVAENRSKLLKRVGDLVGETFGESSPSGELRGNLWQFVAWAKEQGLDIHSPPRRRRD